MTPERLRVLADMYDCVRNLEDALARHREQSVHLRDRGTGYKRVTSTPAAQQRADKIIEQDLEEQLAIAKREFERAN